MKGPIQGHSYFEVVREFNVSIHYDLTLKGPIHSHSHCISVYFIKRKIVTKTKTLTVSFFFSFYLFFFLEIDLSRILCGRAATRRGKHRYDPRHVRLPRIFARRVSCTVLKCIVYTCRYMFKN